MTTARGVRKSARAGATPPKPRGELLWFRPQTEPSPWERLRERILEQEEGRGDNIAARA